MNINEYIEKYATIKKTGNEIHVTMKVPPRKAANLRSEINEESVKRKVTSDDIGRYLLEKGHKNLICLTRAFTIDNCHDRGLEKTWTFESSKPAPRKTTKTKTTKEK
tara:strand:- start:312 stop:632 length:321 start_codon:yes stop_codon:yes gene_type:complete